MKNEAAVHLYNVAAKNWNRLKFRSDKMSDEEKKERYLGIANEIASDISAFLDTITKEDGGHSVLGLPPNESPIEMDEKTNTIQSFLIFKDGKLIKDLIFLDNQRFRVGCIHKTSSKYAGPFPCCCACADDIMEGNLQFFEEGKILAADIRIDTNDYTETELDSDMKCRFCDGRLPVKTEV